MYSFTSRVRFSETDYHQLMTPASIINYFQDCTNFESEHLNIGMDYLQSIHRAWVMSYWQVDFIRYPKECEEITITTWPYDFKGMYGYRNFTMTDHNGEVIARANSLWVLLDTKANRPTRADELVTANYTMDNPLPMKQSDRKITLPDTMTEKPSITVHRYNIDLFMHLNNGQYVRFAQDYVPDDCTITNMRVEYKKSALLGSVILPLVHEGEHTITVALANEEKVPYAIVEFEIRKE